MNDITSRAACSRRRRGPAPRPPTAAPASAVDNGVAAAASDLYDAECALHTARQTHVDAWIAAASDKLHVAVTEYLAAVAARQAPRTRSA